MTLPGAGTSPPNVGGNTYSDREILSSIACRLAEREAEILRHSLAALRKHIPSYSAVPESRLRLSNAHNVRRAVAVLANTSLPDSEELQEAANVTIARASVGVPIEDIIRAYRLSISAIFSQFQDIARELRIPESVMMRGTSLLWELGDMFVARAVLAHQTFSADEDRLRTEHVLAAVNGHGLESADRWPIDHNATFRALVGASMKGGDLKAAREACESQMRRAGCTAAVAIVRESLIGYFSGPHPDAVGEMRLAVGPPGTFDELPSSFSVARLLIDATPLPENRVRDIENSTWRTLVATVPAVSEYLLQTFIEPLEAQSNYGDELLETLTAYLDCNRNVQATALRLNLHPNSLRHRLHRIGDALAVDIRDTSTLVDLSMALELYQRQSVDGVSEVESSQC